MLSVIIPAFTEAKTLGQVLDRVPAVPLLHGVCAYDRIHEVMA